MKKLCKSQFSRVVFCQVGGRVTRANKSTLKLCSFLVLCICACRGNNSNNIPSPKAPVGKIQIDSYIPQYQRDILAGATSYLDTLPLKPNLSSNNLLGLREFSGQKLHQWLEAMVHYMVSKDFDIDDQIYLAKDNVSFENPGDLPDLEQTSSSTRTINTNDAQILMTNLGAGVYAVGKQRRHLYGFNIMGVGKVLITSPRIGILKIGDGVFPLSYQTSSAYNVYLLGILFHEARHSDGRGRSVGFMHSVCPTGHQYAGLLACDKSTNGPYGVEAAVEKYFIQTCYRCTASQKEKLSELLVDTLSRILPSEETLWDDRPEGVNN